MNKMELWMRIKAYQFEGLVPPGLVATITAMFGGGDASVKAFAAKVALKRGWTGSFARRVVEEYKKYVYLGMVSDINVTPPDPIDKVWHQHILFSKGYRAFCKDVLGRDFDHKPELIQTDAQTQMFSAQYLATLALYEREFGVRPPEDIWNVPKFKKELLPAARQPATARQNEKNDALACDLDDKPLCDLFDGIFSNRKKYPEFLPAVIDHEDNSTAGRHVEVGGRGSILLETPEPAHHNHSDTHTGTSHDAGHSSGDHSCSSCSSSSCGSSCGGGGD